MDAPEVKEAQANGNMPESVVSQKDKGVARSPSSHRKSCEICHEPNNVLVRCQIDSTQQWHFVCTSQCWKKVSGGIVDGDANHPYYKYGGMWKNKHAGVSAKKSKPKKSAIIRDWQDSNTRYIMNNRVQHEGKSWICRRSHKSCEANEPGVDYSLWIEAG